MVKEGFPTKPAVQILDHPSKSQIWREAENEPSVSWTHAVRAVGTLPRIPWADRNPNPDGREGARRRRRALESWGVKGCFFCGYP